MEWGRANLVVVHCVGRGEGVSNSTQLHMWWVVSVCMYLKGGAVWLDANSLVEELGCERHCGAQKVQSVSQSQSRVCVESLVEHFFTPTQSNNKKERIVNCASMLLSIEMCCKKSVCLKGEKALAVFARELCLVWRETLKW